MSQSESDARWAVLLDEIEAALARLRPFSFVVLEYDTRTGCDPLPYAQCACEVGGWYCEVVSLHYLPGETWPIDDLGLRRGGWSLPDVEISNWWKRADAVALAAEALVRGLRDGRLCSDPGAFSWWCGTFPSGPDGGEPISIPDRVAFPSAA